MSEWELPHTSSPHQRVRVWVAPSVSPFTDEQETKQETIRKQQLELDMEQQTAFK